MESGMSEDAVSGHVQTLSVLLCLLLLLLPSMPVWLAVQVCLELQQTWMESGVSEDAVSGHIQTLSVLLCFLLLLLPSMPVWLAV
jgi:hypothetical protein